ncbi:hypothetical protein CDCA_CDCA09G2719 [Cyanidium caldarium]|uniref:GLTSCR protein conserved domain-containing protein n=1 Tax=Cyanidium caldarium TaxID=2771 RepID=A0AAV9IWN1_CYACA|nr:hypothetical protein CDCA_CDCA09G2719 [Cyanidium caldarium]|eukprot:ctg_190.g148
MPGGEPPNAAAADDAQGEHRRGIESYTDAFDAWARARNELEQQLRTREQQLAAVQRLLSEKQRPNGDAIRFSLAELSTAQGKLEAERGVLRRTLVEHEHQRPRPTAAPKLPLAEIDRVLGIVGSERSAHDGGDEGPEPAGAQSPTTLALAQLHTEEVAARFVETRETVQAALQVAQTMFSARSTTDGKDDGTEGAVGAEYTVMLPDMDAAKLAQAPSPWPRIGLQHLQAAHGKTAARLHGEYAAILQPDVRTPFQSVDDVWNRLLPYHLFYGQLAPDQQQQTVNAAELSRADAKGQQEQPGETTPQTVSRLTVLEQRLGRYLERVGDSEASCQLLVDQAALQGSRREAHGVPSAAAEAVRESQYVAAGKQVPAPALP